MISVARGMAWRGGRGRTFARSTASERLWLLYSFHARCILSAWSTFFIFTRKHTRRHMKPGAGGMHGRRRPSSSTHAHRRKLAGSLRRTIPRASSKRLSAQTTSFSVYWNEASLYRWSMTPVRPSTRQTSRSLGTM